MKMCIGVHIKGADFWAGIIPAFSPPLPHTASLSYKDIKFANTKLKGPSADLPAEGPKLSYGYFIIMNQSQYSIISKLKILSNETYSFRLTNGPLR